MVFAVENSLQYFADVFSCVAFGDILLELQPFNDKIFLGDLHRPWCCGMLIICAKIHFQNPDVLNNFGLLPQL